MQAMTSAKQSSWITIFLSDQYKETMKVFQEVWVPYILDWVYLKLSEEIKEMKRCCKILENTNVMTAEVEDKNENSWHSCIYYYLLQLKSA